MGTSRLGTFIFCALLASFSHPSAQARSENSEILVKLAPNVSAQAIGALATLGETEDIGLGWFLVKSKVSMKSRAFSSKLNALRQSGVIQNTQPNYRLGYFEDYKLRDAKLQREIQRLVNENQIQNLAGPADNPPIPAEPVAKSGPDPLLGSQWGMMDIGVRDVIRTGGKEVVVAVIDTGVDYTHEDLNGAMWRNPNEVPGNGIDDDGNGYIDDIVGWDFVSNDNLPFDLSVSLLDLLKGGNPGHGTHCAGNVGAKSNNSLGVTGAAANVKIMAIRFLSEKGQGTTADAVKAVRYAVANKARVLSNSWGSEGEDPADGANNQALRDAVQYAQDKGSLFIAAAGNGHNGVGYDNDTDEKPGYPASYPHDAIISVAALDVNNNLGAFSNWGVQSVDIGAPGVKVFSTTVGGKYDDKVINLPQLNFVVYWDGTSMATPHVAGAAAAYWSMNPEKNWKQVKEAMLSSATRLTSLEGKVTSGGKLDMRKFLAK